MVSFQENHFRTECGTALQSIPEWARGSGKARGVNSDFIFINVLYFNREQLGPSADTLFRDIYPILSSCISGRILHNEMENINK